MFSDFDFDAIVRALPYLFRDGMTFTVTLTLLSALLGLGLGTLLALARISGGKVLSTIVTGYVNLMRSLPLVLVIFWFYFLVPYLGQWLTGAPRPIKVGGFSSALLTFALFEAVGVPRKIKMQYGGEEVLQVDTFRQAVGGDQHPLGLIGHGRNTVTAEIIGVFAGHHFHMNLWGCLAQQAGKVVAKIAGCGEVAAENDGVEASLEILRHDAGGGGQFGILGWSGNGFKRGRQFTQAALLRVGPGAFLHQLDGRGVGIERSAVEQVAIVDGRGRFVIAVVGVGQIVAGEPFQARTQHGGAGRGA